MSTSAATDHAETGPPPEPGATLYIEGVLGGPWLSVLSGRAGDTITMSAPRRAGTPVGLASGREFLLCYSVRAVPCEVDAVWVEGPVEIAGERAAVVRMVGAPRRLQRRGAVRVPVQIIVRARSAEDADPPLSVAAVTENLSAGGALLRMGEAVEPGREMVVTLQPPGEAQVIEVPSRVVRSDRDPAGPRAWRVALAFTDLARYDEERLVRYVFRLQREARARETGMGQ